MTQTEIQPITYYTVTLGELTRAGHALAEINTVDENGENHTNEFIVPAGLPGEHVTIAVEAPYPVRPGRTGRRHRHRKARPPRVWITEIHKASPLRIQAPCPVFGICGGCQLQHMRYEAQCTWKTEIVRQLLNEIGHFSQPPLLDIVPCAIPWHYRNHMRFSVDREGRPGLTARNSHRVLPLTECPIAHEKINHALKIVSEHVNPRPQVVLRTATANAQLLVQPAASEEVEQALNSAGLEVRSETMEEILAGHSYRIRPSSFFQTNIPQAEQMARMVLDGLFSDFSPEQTRTMTVIDAYCGVGTFSALIAPHVSRVIAIEESASAIKDAHYNLDEDQSIGKEQQVDILKGKVEEVLPELCGKIDGFVIDPPRAGCMPVVLDALVHHPVQRIVYVSCDPATLARDLNILCHQHAAYRLRSVQPLDMFPQTAHIECIAILDAATH
jgi:23S rRNA (uracil1939-C5)-methyltransferase